MAADSRKTRKVMNYFVLSIILNHQICITNPWIACGCIKSAVFAKKTFENKMLYKLYSASG